MQAINPLELAMEALKEIQLRFYRDFPPHPKEEVYGFATPSTMKPTQWSCEFSMFPLFVYVYLYETNPMNLLSHRLYQKLQFHLFVCIQIREVESIKFQQSVPFQEMSGL